MAKTILLTGGTGFLGNKLLRFLLENSNYKFILTVINDSTVDRVSDLKEKIDLVHVDRSGWQEELKKFEIDHILHLATNYGRAGESFLDIVNSNFNFPMELLKIALDKDVKSFINTDTSLPEDINPYALSKKQLLAWLKFHSSNISVINMTLEHFYGENDGKFVSNMMKKMIDNEPEIDLTHGEQRRDFIYFEDVLKAYKCVLAKSSEISGFNNFEVGSGESLPIKELLLKIKEISKSSSQLNFGKVPTRENEPVDSVANISNITELGWKAEVSLEDGLKTIYSKMK